MKGHRILITGSAGELGGSLVEYFSRDNEVVQLDVRAPEREGAHADGVYVGSVADPELVAQAIDGVDAVIHAGAIPGTRKPYEELLSANVVGTFVLLEAAGASATVERFAFISSITWHGFHGPAEWRRTPPCLPIHEGLESVALDYYACTKVQAEYWCAKYAERFRKPVVALRSSRIMRPCQEVNMKASDPIPGTPHLHDYVGTGDLVDAVERALEYNPPDGYEAFLTNSVDQHTVIPSIDLVAMLYPEVKQLDREKLEAYEGFGALVDCSRAHERLGWMPEFRCAR